MNFQNKSFINILGAADVDASRLQLLADSFHLASEINPDDADKALDIKERARQVMFSELAGRALIYFSSKAVNEDGPLRNVGLMAVARDVVLATYHTPLKHVYMPDDIKVNLGLGLMIEPIDETAVPNLPPELVELHGCASLWDNLILPLNSNDLVVSTIPSAIEAIKQS